MQTLLQWFRVGEEEKKTLFLLQDAVLGNRLSSVKCIMANASLETLIKLSVLSPAIDTFFQKDELATCWAKKLKDWPDNSTYRIRSCSPLTEYENIKGLLFYLKAAQVRTCVGKPFSVNELAYLTESAKYRCYYAYDALLIVNMRDYTKETDPHRFLQPAINAALYHWTPGYCLLYEALRFLGNKMSDHIYYHKALEALIMAKKLQSYPEAQQAIHNAYFGKGLIKGNNNQFNNWGVAFNDIMAKGSLTFQELRSSSFRSESAAREYYRVNHSANDLLVDIPMVSLTR